MASVWHASGIRPDAGVARVALTKGFESGAQGGA